MQGNECQFESSRLPHRRSMMLCRLGWTMPIRGLWEGSPFQQASISCQHSSSNVDRRSGREPESSTHTEITQSSQRRVNAIQRLALVTFLDVGPQLVFTGAFLKGFWEFDGAGAEIPEEDPKRVHVDRVIVLSYAKKTQAHVQSETVTTVRFFQINFICCQSFSWTNINVFFYNNNNNEKKKLIVNKALNAKKLI